MDGVKKEGENVEINKGLPDWIGKIILGISISILIILWGFVAVEWGGVLG